MDGLMRSDVDFPSNEDPVLRLGRYRVVRAFFVVVFWGEGAEPILILRQTKIRFSVLGEIRLRCNFAGGCFVGREGVDSCLIFVN